MVLNLEGLAETSAGRGAGSNTGHRRKRARDVRDSSNTSRQSEEVIVIDD
jgi:hypothetical protein